MPGQSTGAGEGSLDSRRRSRAADQSATPIGRFSQKIHSQPRPSTSAPPTRGPIASAAPLTAPQMPRARPREAS